MNAVCLILCVWFQVILGDKLLTSIDRFVNNKELQIGFYFDGNPCPLVWRGGGGYNAEFRCAEAKGDPMYVRKRGDKVEIGTTTSDGVCPLKLARPTKFEHYAFGIGKTVNTTEIPTDGRHNAYFACGASPDLFEMALGTRPWNKKEYTVKINNCYLTWNGDEGDTKNAEFRCNMGIGASFYISNDECKLTKVEVLGKAKDTNRKAEAKDVEIVGIATGQSCYRGSQSTQLSHTDSVTKSTSIGLSQENERNWEVGAEVGVSAAIFGTGVSMSVSASTGGSSTMGRTEEESTSKESSTTASQSVSFNGPGSAMLVGYVTRYTYNNPTVDAKLYFKCKNNYTTTMNDKIELHNQDYSSVDFIAYVGEYKRGKCNEKRLNCVRNIKEKFTRKKNIKNIGKLGRAFNRCFPKSIAKRVKKQKPKLVVAKI